MKRKILSLYLLGTIILASCNAPLGGLVSGIPSDGESPPVDADSAKTSTPTPFGPESTDSTQDEGPTGEIPPAELTPTPTQEYPWGDFSPPARESPIAIPPPVEAIDLASEITTFVLLGSDEAPHRYGHRTDTIILVVLDKDNDHAVLLSIPRDLYVYVPGWRVDRINTADLFGGWDMVAETFLYNFGIEPDFWVRVNFAGFEGAVDLLGGIEVEVGRYLNDECGGVQWEYFSGTHSMDGFTALCYVRMRKTTSDFDRLRRQQEVMEAIFKRVLSLDGLTRIPQLYSEFNKHFDSNVGLGDILPLVPLGADLASGNATVVRYSIDSSLATPWIVPATGASVLLPDREGIQELFQGLFEF
jgi:LCP family protein required for cell wall assembly